MVPCADTMSAPKGTPSMAYYVYILRCSTGTFYTGSTTDLAARERAHNEGRGAKYTAGRRPVRMVYSETHESRSAAQVREAQIKRLTRAKKEALVERVPLLRPQDAGGINMAHAPRRDERRRHRGAGNQRA
jgi:putative endonuclease